MHTKLLLFLDKCSGTTLTWGILNKSKKKLVMIIFHLNISLLTIYVSIINFINTGICLDIQQSIVSFSVFYKSITEFRYLLYKITDIIFRTKIQFINTISITESLTNFSMFDLLWISDWCRNPPQIQKFVILMSIFIICKRCVSFIQYPKCYSNFWYIWIDVIVRP